MVETQPVVAIVGRPNVGKSSFFNRCIGKRNAIVFDSPGVTRDRIYKECNWAGHQFMLVDTGGLVPNTKDEIVSQVKDQVILALEEADIILFMVDGKEGLVGGDENIASLLRRTQKPILLAVNKIDDLSEETNLLDFYRLGIGEPYPISALHGTGGIGDLLDQIVASFPKNDEPDTSFQDQAGHENAYFSMAIVGRPNVGKSSLINAICGSRRTIVSSTAGTTRDATDTIIKYGTKRVNLIDTAGIRRKSKVQFGVEAFSIVRSIKAISRADVVVLIIDATETITDQDQKIGAKIDMAGKAAVIAVNKWDLAEEKSSTAMNKFTETAKTELPHLNYAEVIFTSALMRQRLPKVLEAAEKAYLESDKRINTAVLNQIFNEAQILNPPPSGLRKRKLRIYYATQVSTRPPTFMLFVNDRRLLTRNYEAYLERKIREAFGFKGTPIRLLAKAKDRQKT